MQRKLFLSSCLATVALGARPLMAAAAESAYDLVTPSGTIFGTLITPSAAPPTPVVLIIAGSGPTDRNGNGPMLNLNIYSKLAIALADSGIASVRYDKRGVAASQAALSSESAIRFDTYVDDAVAWIKKLRSDPRFSRVIVVGHSEGSLIGMIAAQRAHVDAYVSLEGAGFPAATVLASQLQTNAPGLADKWQPVLDKLSSGATVPAADVAPELESLFRPSVQPYLISWFKYDPRVEIAKLSGPVVIVQGTHDIQVVVADGQALAAAAPRAKYIAIDGMTHVLTDDPGTTLAQQRSGAYADAARPLDATLIGTLVAATR
jgi:pimeloyl-ACP methyl ester carboxylesterase